MKANAPEKIYLHLTTGNHLLNGKYYEYKPAKIRYDDKIIEYCRTDAFIEKAKVYLIKNQKGFILTDKDITDFINYIKGE